MEEILSRVDPIAREKYAAEYTAINGKELKVPTLITEVPPIPYSPQSKVPQKHLHIGQLKLILSEIQFLTPRPIGFCIYAGAAPSHKGALLAAMFPRVKFLLIDPREFSIVPFASITEVNLLEFGAEIDPSPDTCRRILGEVLSGDGNLYTACSYFTETFARAVAEVLPRDGVYFVSDIRTSPDGVMPADVDIVYNNAQMALWMHVMNPAASLVKFRHPFYDDVGKFTSDAAGNDYAAGFLAAKTTTGIDFVANAAQKRMEFPPGDVYLQAFAPKNSTETRLLVTRPRTVHDWGTADDYDARMFTWNSLLRSYGFYQNPDASRGMGFDHCADCALCGKICRAWIKAFPKVAAGLGLNSVRILLQTLLKWSGTQHARTLQVGEHGKKFAPQN